MDNGKLLARWAAHGDSDVFHATCPARQVLDHITSRWGIWVLLGLRERDLRFHELRDRIEGISEKMLSQTVRTLVRDGLVWRDVEPATPPKVTYGLTELGRGAAVQLGAMFDWLRTNADDMVAVQERYDVLQNDS
ncbi:MAG: helix-turn-helix transcriptional regulator [Mycobacteriaceae bacterium]|nr:helix-turn-helix transcriptional regulator [Mycobacteriaceae bacterium]